MSRAVPFRMIIELRERASLSGTVNPVFGGRSSILAVQKRKQPLTCCSRHCGKAEIRCERWLPDIRPSRQDAAVPRFKAEEPPSAGLHIHESRCLQRIRAIMTNAIAFECQLLQGALRNGGRTPYVSHRQIHSAGPKRNRRSQRDEATSCTAQTAATTPTCPTRSTAPNQPRPCP